MGFLDEIKRLARPYEDEEDEEEFDDYEPVSRSERMDRTGGERLERRAAKSSQENTGTLYPVENERRSNKVVNIHTTTQLQVVLVKPERFENATCWTSCPAWPTPTRARSRRWPFLLTSSRPTTWTSSAI